MPPGANQVESDHNGQAGMRTYAGFVLRGTGARWRGADGGHDGMSGTGLGGSRELTSKQRYVRKRPTGHAIAVAGQSYFRKKGASAASKNGIVTPAPYHFVSTAPPGSHHPSDDEDQ